MALVVFIRGVNVGGHKTFRPSELATRLRGYGVVNIGAAGTFIIRKPVSQAKLRAEVLRCLPFEAEVMICTGKELAEAVAAQPYDGEPGSPDLVRFVSVLGRRCATAPELPIMFPAEGKWLLKIVDVRERFVFGHYRREMKAIGFLGKLDKVFGSPATTRNWNTIAAILKALAKD